jgi:sulfhydrogenase subunit alpha
MSAVNVNVDVHHLTRVEGHGDIVINVKNGVIEECQWQVVEAPRFFEAMLRGRPYQEASHITSRICGICSVGHATASLRATETALGVEVSEQTELLRKLLFHGEMIDSHVLHVYMLVAPDFLGVGSVIPLASSHPEVVLRALRIKKLSGDLCAMLAGRHTHPVAMTVGGFTHLPTVKELLAMRERLVAARVDMDETIALAATLPWPAFERETEYVSLQKDDEYAYIDESHQRASGAPIDGQVHASQPGKLYGRRAGPVQQQLRSASSSGQGRCRSAGHETHRV